MNPTNQPCFHFIGMSIVDLAVSLGRVDDLAICGAISTKADVTIGFFWLSLW